MYHKWLRSFHAVAREGGFTAASKVLNVGQPTITDQVKALERQFGVELFHRRGRTVTLTDTGQQLLGFTQDIFGHEEEAVGFLTAARDLTLGGDLQHAGCHFRAHAEVAAKGTKFTSYLWEPKGKVAGNGKVLSKDWKWARLQFPIGKNWYSATQFNAQNQPVEELSWRDYGRFGFFFKKDLKKGETQKLNYRFHIAPSQAPALESYPPQVSKDQKERWTATAQKAYTHFSHWIVKQ